jgi:hypothetical protein
MLMPSGKFSAMYKYTYDKACRAFYSMQSGIKHVTGLSVSTQIKLFDTMIKPVILYGAEVWGAYLNKDISNVNAWLQNVKSLMEKLHSKVCKNILQVHRNTNNYAVRCELGRSPLIIDVVCRVLKYFVNVCERSEKSLVKVAFSLHKMSLSPWYHFIHNVFKLLGFNNNILGNNIESLITDVKNKLITMSKKLYIEKLKDYSKLELYASIKTQCRREPYLLYIQNKLYRKSVSQLRLSSHKLPIETGRWRGLNREERLCTFCKKFLANEKHCVIECVHPVLLSLRNNFLSIIFGINNKLKYLPIHSLFNYIMLFTDTNILRECAKYIHKIVNLFA